MPGFLVQVGAAVRCAHAGQAQLVPNPRVLLSGQPSVLVTAPCAVVGCTLPPPPGANGPCVTGQWLSGTVRVTSSGQPLVVFSSTSLCAPTGTPLLITATQTRVSAS